jgi:hypothetical protein
VCQMLCRIFARCHCFRAVGARLSVLFVTSSPLRAGPGSAGSAP